MLLIRLVIICALTLCAAGLLTAASATALLTPEWWQSGKAITATKKVFFLGLGNAAKFTTTTNIEIKCTKSKTQAGETEGPKTLSKVVIGYEGCSNNGGGECQNQGIGSKKFITSDLEGTLAYLKGGKSLPAGALLNEEIGAEKFAELECETLLGKVKLKILGHVIAELKPTNIEQKTGEIVFKQKSAGVQEWEKVEEGATIYHLISFEEKPTSVENTQAIEFLNAEALELKG